MSRERGLKDFGTKLKESGKLPKTSLPLGAIAAVPLATLWDVQNLKTDVASLKTDVAKILEVINKKRGWW